MARFFFRAFKISIKKAEEGIFKKKKLGRVGCPLKIASSDLWYINSLLTNKRLQSRVSILFLSPDILANACN